MRGIVSLGLGLAVAATAAVAAPSRLIIARGAWAAFDRGAVCEAVARPLAPVRKSQAAAYVSIAFDRGGPRQGQLFTRLARPARPGSSVLLTIGSQPFMLVARGASAWSSDARQEAVILAAMRVAGGMRIDSRDAGGRRSSVRFLLDGAPTAIDAAAAACSLPR